jgi:hypothetical protein
VQFTDDDFCFLDLQRVKIRSVECFKFILPLLKQNYQLS